MKVGAEGGGMVMMNLLQVEGGDKGGIAGRGGGIGGKVVLV